MALLKGSRASSVPTSTIVMSRSPTNNVQWLKDKAISFAHHRKGVAAGGQPFSRRDDRPGRGLRQVSRNLDGGACIARGPCRTHAGPGRCADAAGWQAVMAPPYAWRCILVLFVRDVSWADYHELIKTDGDLYLKRLIEDTVRSGLCPEPAAGLSASIPQVRPVEALLLRPYSLR
jgi:hypothetical protein